jgi:integrase
MKFHKSLNDTKVKAAKPGAADYKLSDGGGMYLLVTTKGAKYWRGKYRIAGVEKKGSYGIYPAVSLEAARKAHEAAKGHVAQGDNPVEVKRKDKAAKVVAREKHRPFGEIADEWLAAQMKTGKSHNTTRRHVYNVKVLKAGFGKVAISDVRKAHLTEVLLAFENQGNHETRRRVQVDALAIMEMAHDRDYVETNHFAGVTFKSYTTPGSVHEPRPAVTDAVGFGRLLGDIDRMPARTAAALRLLALTMLRPGELLQTEWQNIDWKRNRLVVPFSVLKMRTKRKGSDAEGRNLEVPLSRQALAELKALHRLTGEGRYLFPAQSTGSKVQHMRGYILNRALDRAEYSGIHCPHGFRSSASTMLNAERRIVGGEEVLRWPDQTTLIELQLDHNDASVAAIYNRGGRWKERCDLMQLWADRIDEMRGKRLRLVA